ncbi:MAG: replicative DNA helicase [Firmicutes bacterium]|nr:replicative DNA helicase [Bacillota bacterium]MDY3092666.1 replicative DNA helicase [Erysipelotrichaceae bacterium]
MNDRTMPYSLEAEESLLGNIMLYDEAMRQTVEAGILSEDFYFDNHRKIYNIMYSMYEKKESIDTVSLSTKLKDFEYYDKVGGADFILRLAGSTISNANTKDYIRIIKNKSYARKVIEAANKIADEGYDGKLEIEDLLDEAENRILGITRSRAMSDFKKSSEVFDATLEKIQRIYDQGDTITGIKSMYSDLDRMTTGFQRGDLIILAARPSVGKTAFALNISLNAASVSSGAVAIFSLEMPADQLASRMLSAKSRVAGQKLRTGKLDNNDWSKVNEAVSELRRQKIYIDDTPGIKVSDIFAKCRTLKNDAGLSLIIIDYIQLIQGSGKNESRQQEVSEISRRLKALARELDVPVIALSQLSRGVEKREDKRPMLSDLRESGAIEQDADLVMFLYRDEYYNRKDEEERAATEEVELNLAKHRNGPTGLVKLMFEREINAFYGIKTE